MTNKQLKQKYYSEKSIRWYDNIVDYSNWLEDQLIEALRQPPVSGSVADAVGRNCPFCGEPCSECSHKATCR